MPLHIFLLINNSNIRQPFGTNRRHFKAQSRVRFREVGVSIVDNKLETRMLAKSIGMCTKMAYMAHKEITIRHGKWSWPPPLCYVCAWRSSWLSKLIRFWVTGRYMQTNFEAPECLKVQLYILDGAHWHQQSFDDYLSIAEIHKKIKNKNKNGIFIGDKTMRPKNAMWQHICRELPLRGIKSNALVYQVPV